MAEWLPPPFRTHLVTGGGQHCMVDHNVHYFSNDPLNKINLCCNVSQIYLLCCRLPDQALQQRQRLKEAPSEQLYPSLDSLNQLGSIPWQVNTPVSI